LARTIPNFISGVSIEGVIISVDFQLTSANPAEFFIQDQSGAIRLFSSNKLALPPGTLVG